MYRKVNAVGKTRKRKAPAKRKTTRRRRVSGIGKIDIGGVLMDAAGLAGGSILARVGSTIVLKQFPQVSQTMIGVGQIAAGVLLPMVMKNKLGRDLGNGMIAFGGQVVAVNLGIISGVGYIPSNTMQYRIGAGSTQISPISGTTKLLPINGVGATTRQQVRKYVPGERMSLTV